MKDSCYSIMDTYTAHRKESVRKEARASDIEVVFVPPWCTDIVQPLYIKVSRALKSYARVL